MYESRHQPLLHRAGFVRRVLGHATAVLGLVLASIAIGMAGYVAFERLSWTDAFVETAMLLGPVVHRLLHHFHLERSRRDG